MGKHCIYCGSPLPEAASFCPHCARSQIAKKPMRPPRFRRKAAVLLLLAVVLLGGVLVWPYVRSAQTHAELPTEEPSPPTTETQMPETTAAPTETEPAVSLPPRLETREERSEYNSIKMHQTFVDVYIQAGNSQTQNRFFQSYSLRKIDESPNDYTAEELYRPSGARYSTYVEGPHGYLEYLEYYENGQKSYHLLAYYGTSAEVSTYDPDGTRTSHTVEADGPALIAERRKTLDDMIALLEEHLAEDTTAALIEKARFAK